MAGEYEIKNAQAMKIMDSFGVGFFTQYYAMDYNDDVVLMGHDGPGHIGIAEGKTKVRPLEVYHGKVGKGLSVEMSVKHGPVTLLSVVQKVDGTLMLLVAEGESVPGPIMEICVIPTAGIGFQSEQEILSTTGMYTVRPITVQLGLAILLPGSLNWAASSQWKWCRCADKSED